MRSSGTKTYLGLMLSLLLTAWAVHAFCMMTMKMSPSGMPSTHPRSSWPPRRWPFVSKGDLLNSMGDPEASCQYLGISPIRMSSCNSGVAKSWMSGERRVSPGK